MPILMICKYIYIYTISDVRRLGRWGYIMSACVTQPLKVNQSMR